MVSPTQAMEGNDYEIEEQELQHNLETEIPRFNFEIRKTHLMADSVELVLKLNKNWKRDKIVCKELCDGITNKLVLLEHDDQAVLIRTYGHNSNILIDRKRELLNMLKLSKYGLSSKLKGTFTNGILYGFIPGRVFTVDDMKDPKLSKLVIDQMAEWHKLFCDPKPKLFVTLNRWIKAVPSLYTAPKDNKIWREAGLSLQKLNSELQWLQTKLEALDSPVVFCHNDLLSGNLVYDKVKNRVVFIDYEYGCSSYRGFDIANHFCEYAGFDCEWEKLPSKEYQLDWIRSYLEKMESDESPEIVYEEVRLFTLAAHYYWCIWALVQAEVSDIDFPYLTYGIKRIKQYYLSKTAIKQ